LFADPLSISHTPPTGATAAVALTGSGSAAYSFVCTGRSPTYSTYRYDTGGSGHYIDLFIGRQETSKSRTRYTVRFTEHEFFGDPLDDSKNVGMTSSAYVVFDLGPLGQGTNWAKLSHMLASLLYDPTDAAQAVAPIWSGAT